MKTTIGKVVFAALIISVSVGSSYFLLKREEKTGYVDLNKVFQKFEYKLELEKKLVKVNEMRKQKLDSLEFELSVLVKQVEAEKARDKEKLGLFQAKKEYFFRKKQEFEQDNGELVKQYDEQILKQLTQYVNDYGKANDYSYILGADGNGTIMYGKPANDISDNVIAFINSKYKGLN